MLTLVTLYAWRLDRWLKRRLGRPYTIILGVSLLAGMGAELHSLGQAFGSTQGVTAICAGVVVQAALLINQLAQLHAYGHARRRRRAARRKAEAAAKAS